MTERLILVDENDQPVGVGDRQEAWARGYYTRNISVMLRDQNGRILSQKRNKQVASYPGMWTVAASGHVDEGETWDTAAYREAQEEIGISTDLKHIGNCIFKDDVDDKKIRRIIHVYEGVIDSSTQFTLQEAEVDDTKWYTLDELRYQIQQQPEQFTPVFREIIDRFYSTDV
jgi:isopentenyl-diphosphate delta-isomerase